MPRQYAHNWQGQSMHIHNSLSIDQLALHLVKNPFEEAIDGPWSEDPVAVDTLSGSVQSDLQLVEH